MDFCFAELDYLTAFGFPKMFYLKHKEKSSVFNAFSFMKIEDLDYLTAFGEPVLAL
jgi:hypothetical protein